jgi:phage terminase large subunit-like protein
VFETKSAGWDLAHRKRLDFSGIAEHLGPEDSIASYLVRRTGSVDGMRRLFDVLDDGAVESLVFDLDFWARRQQIPPNWLWDTCVMLAGRGFGKTFAGARWAIWKATQGKTNGALIGQTAADVRDTMISGSSGILKLSPPWFLPKYEPSKRRLTWPNGVIANCYSADKPDQARGPNTGWVWGDEPASWKDEMAMLDQVPMFNRIGTSANPPQTLLTGTPRPLKKLEELIKRPTTALVSGSSLANRAFLAPSTIRNMRALAATRWGKQEVLGQLLLDVPGALFQNAKWRRIEADPVEYRNRLERCVVAVDPAPTSETGADESGIVVEGMRHENGLKHVSVLADLSRRDSPKEWAATAIRAYVQYRADALVVEVNTGGEMTETLITSVAQEMGVVVNVKPVRAREAKSKRAEPVAALAESGRIEFVGPLTSDDGQPKVFPKLEKQLEKFIGINGRRDDRADAFCWGVHDLVFGETFFAFF